MGSAGMKRSTRAFGDRVLCSGRRMFASRYVEVKRLRLTSVVVVDTEEIKAKLLDYGMEIHDKEPRETKLGISKKVNGNETLEVLGISEEKQEGIVSGESKKMSLVDGNHDYGDNVSRIKQFGAVYTRKRKRALQTDSSSNSCSFDESHGKDKMYEKKYFRKKVRTSLKSGFDGKDVLRKGPIVFAVPCSYNTDDNVSGVHLFSCFVTSVLRYLKMTKLFSWRRLYSFVLSETAASKYLSSGFLFPQDSACTMSHRFFKVSGSINCIPFFTVNFNSLPYCFLYIHLSLHLKFAFMFYAFIIHSVDENVRSSNAKMPSIGTIKRDQNVDKDMVAKKARSARKRVPRVSLFNKVSCKKDQAHDESIVPVPGVKEIERYAEKDYVPFMLPESYICSRGDELSRTLETSYPVYDMDSDDEQWLENFKTEQVVSEDTFENVIDEFERGIYCSPDDYSEAASAINLCQELASKEVLEAVYSYWMTKRKKKRSPLIRVFQCYRRKRVTRQLTNSVRRKKRSSGRPASKGSAKKQPDSKKAILNDEKMVKEAAKASIRVHEAQEAARRAEETAIAKRQRAQALMENADLATFRAMMALRIAEAAASACHTTGATLD